MLTEKVVVGMGEVLWDVFPGRKKLGGAPANFAYTAGQMGLNSCVISAIGDDELGRDIITQFNTHSVNYHFDICEHPTGQVLVQLDDKGIPQYEICKNVAWDNIRLTSDLEDLARRTTVLCFGSLAQRSEKSRHAINRFLDIMPNTNDSLKIFDINLRQQFYTKEILENSFHKANVLKTNDEEVEVIAQLFGYAPQDMQSVCRALVCDYNLKMLILTCGVAGSYVFTKNTVSYQPTPLVKVADTVGAGDSFTASFCAALLKGKPIAEAHKFAVDVSAYVCTKEDAMVHYPADILNFINN